MYGLRFRVQGFVSWALLPMVKPGEGDSVRILNGVLGNLGYRSAWGVGNEENHMEKNRWNMKWMIPFFEAVEFLKDLVLGFMVPSKLQEYSLLLVIASYTMDVSFVRLFGSTAEKQA